VLHDDFDFTGMSKSPKQDKSGRAGPNAIETDHNDHLTLKLRAEGQQQRLNGQVREARRYC
jgi:hypothetical protein